LCSQTCLGASRERNPSFPLGDIIGAMFRPCLGASVLFTCMGASIAEEHIRLEHHSADTNPFKSFFKGFEKDSKHAVKSEKFLKADHAEHGKSAEVKPHKSSSHAAVSGKQTHGKETMSHAIKKLNGHGAHPDVASQLDEVAKSTVSTVATVAKTEHAAQEKEQAEPQQHVQLAVKKVDMQVTHRTCDQSAEGCASMCKWLKMTDRDSNGRCPLFEWQLKSCDYTPADQRIAGAEETEPIDCAVDLMRATVYEADVANYVNQLDVCIEGLPTKVNATCYVGLGLLRSEINDWKAEARLKEDADVLRMELGNCSALGKLALDTKTDEQEAIDKLTTVLAKAEDLPGHYLVDEVHNARSYLDKLGPIPAVRKQLKAAMADAHLAFATTSLFRVKESMVWLHVAINKGTRYALAEPVPEARLVLDKLTTLKDALVDLKEASFQGNVSYTTQSSVPEGVVRLRGAIVAATAAGLTNEMPIARDLLKKLETLEAAVVATANATATGQTIIQTPGAKTIDRLEDAVAGLNTTVSRDIMLGLNDNATTMGGVATLDQLLYIKHAREALTKSIAYGRKELYGKGNVLNDDGEEAALDVLGPAVEWGQEVGITKGIPVAQALISQLTLVEEAKEAMAVALELGNASIKSKSGISEAVTQLTESIGGSENANTTAGIATATEQIKLLKAIGAARAALHKASVLANASSDSRSGYDGALAALNASIAGGVAAGLDEESRVRQDQMRKLDVFKKADVNLKIALARMAPPRGPPEPRPLEDDVPNLVFNRSGLKVEDLPAVPNAADDGDTDFDEHIAALSEAIAAAKDDGLVDPEMKNQLETVRAQKRAHIQLLSAAAVGTEALETKAEIEYAITRLTASLEEAREMSMMIGVTKAQSLLDKLNIIQPARDELKASILQANVSMHTVSGMDAALVRLNAAIELNRKLELFAVIPKAERTRDELMLVKKTYVAVKAAIMQGQLALKAEEGEEAAIAELNTAIENADKIDLHKGLPVAVDLLHELMHMNAQHQQLQAAMDPRGKR